MKSSKILKELSQAWKKYSWWQWLLFCIGFIAILSVIGALFLAVGSEPPGKYNKSPVPSVNDPTFISSISYGLHLQTGKGGTVTPLINGDAFRKSLLESFDQAHSSINFDVYIWENGEFSKRVIDKLTEKQRQGVEVRVLLDAYGSKTFDEKELQPLKDAGGKVEKFRSVKFGQLTRFLHRDHRRAIVIDGVVGYTGGMAVADKWLGNAENIKQWRDDMYKLSGPLVPTLQGDFMDLWAGLTGEFLVGDKFYPPIASGAPSSSLQYVHVSQNPSPDVQILPDFITVSIKAARTKLYIETPYFLPNAQLLDAIIDRAKNGVDVRMILPNKYNDSKLDRWASHHYYQQLLDAGVKIYEYQPTFNHTKFMVIDSQWSIIGSPNLNTRSRRLDQENAFGILDAQLGATHEQIFQNDIQHAQEITSAKWRGRTIFIHPLEWLAQIFGKQI